MSGDECWCEYVDIGVGMQRAAEAPGCPEHDPYDGSAREDICPGCVEQYCTDGCTLEDRLWPDRQTSVWPYEAAFSLIDAFRALAPVVLECDRVMQRSTWALIRPCACPTPTHRMSCGQGATPKVVAK